jgi:plasmid segregation protein ParM
MPREINVIDLGNGDFKVTNGSGVNSFPAVVGQFSSQPSHKLQNVSQKIDFMSFIKDDKEYAIGNNAIKNCRNRSHDLTEDKYTSDNTNILINSALTLMANQNFSVANVVIALPVHKMNIAGDIINKFEGKQFGGKIGYFGEYSGVQKVINVDKAIAIEQPWGTLFKNVLNERGEINKEKAKKGTAVFDIGFKTNDGIVFRNLDTIGRLTIHSKNGMHVAYEEIRNKVSQSFGGIEIQLFEVTEIVKCGRVNGVAIPNIINDALYNLAYNIILEVKSKWADAWEIEEIIFTGGGAEVLKPYLVQAFPNAIFDNATANAEGLLYYARRIWGGE